ncbi:MAG: endonuclease MutS2 [Acidithiobacillus sp.]
MTVDSKASPVTLREAVLHSLDLPRLRDAWVRECAHGYGRRHAREASPWVGLAQVQERLLWSQALESRRLSGHDLPVPHIPDVDALLDLATRPGAALSGRELRLIHDVLTAQRSYWASLSASSSEDILTPLVAQLAPPGALLQRLDAAVDEDGELRDGASPALAAIRQRIRASRAELQRFLQGLLRAGDLADAWQDQVIALRGERYVLPLKATHKGRLRGIIHDRSASGETLFIEPLTAVDLNNRLVQERREEGQEQERIRQQLTAAIGAVAVSVAACLGLMGRLDAVRAGLALGQRFAGRLPSVAADARFALRQLRHPLLCLQHGADAVVGNDISLGGEVRQLLISGPNTGGKTALLKALGLSHLLAYLGLPVAAEGIFGYFPQIFTVIGDAQDINADLSTFSSQLLRLKAVLAAADAQSLILLDEMGSGTDPREGGALAQAVAAELLRRGACSLITSHLEVMKRYALGRPAVLLAGMAFDPERLAPTYRLQWGVGGASHGLAIARRVGLPATVVDAAQGLLADDRDDWERWETQREGLLEDAQRAAAEAEQARAAAQTLELRLARELEAIRQERAAAAEAARAQWEKALSDGRRQIRESIAALKSGRDTQAAWDALAAADRPFQESAAAPAPAPLPQPGDTGLFLPLRQAAQVLAVDGAQGRVQIALRGKTLWVPLQQFSCEQGVQIPKEAGRAHYLAPETLPWRLDLRGQRREEALQALCRHIDDAVAAGRREVEVLHGTGNGILAEMVREFARSDPRIGQWRMARPEQGGGGVSELELR